MSEETKNDKVEEKIEAAEEVAVAAAEEAEEAKEEAGEAKEEAKEAKEEVAEVKEEIAEVKEEAKPEEKPEPSGKFKELIKQIEELSVLELSELVKELEDRFGVSAAAAVAMAAAGGADEVAGDGVDQFTLLAGSGDPLAGGVVL